MCIYSLLNIFPNDEFVEIGWRILFFTGLIPGLVALIIRVKMVESKVWLESKEQRKEIHKTPLKNILSDKVQRKRIFFALIIMTGLMYSYYTSIGFMPVFLEKFVEINKNDVAIIMIEVTVAALLGTIFTGLVSQFIGRMKIITIFAIASIGTIRTITLRFVYFYKYPRKNIFCIHIDIFVRNSIWSYACVLI